VSGFSRTQESLVNTHSPPARKRPAGFFVYHPDRVVIAAARSAATLAPGISVRHLKFFQRRFQFVA